MWLIVLLVMASISSPNGLRAQPITGTSSNNVAFQLTLTPDVVEDSITDNVTLECANYGPVASKVTLIASLQIRKRQDGNIWATFAEIRENEPNVRTNENILATGSIGDTTFLRIVWPKASNETFGQYRCDVVGYDNNFENAEEYSPMLTIIRHNITTREVLYLLLKEEEYNRQELAQQTQEQNNRFSEIMTILNQTQNLNNYLSEQLNKLIQAQNNLQNRTQMALQKLETDMANRTDPLIHEVDLIFADLKIIANISHTSSTVTTLRTTATTTVPATLSPLRTTACRNKTFENGVEKSSWPEGTFGLLMPDTGCPLDNECTEWETSFYKFDTEMDSNHNEVSNNSRLSTPIQEKGERNKTYMYQRFCVVTTEYPNPPWPNGTYCINRGIKPCPPGFEEGWIHFDEEDTDHPVNIVGGVTPYKYNIGNIFYCCRADAPHDTPVILPTSKPFYLYRYQNGCQMVDGMHIVEEYMLFDTENYDNQDNADKANNHPDAIIHDVSITICYYYTDNM